MAKLIKIKYGMFGSEKVAYINPDHITSIQIDPQDDTNGDVNLLGCDTGKHCYKNVTLEGDILGLMNGEV